MSFTCSCGQRFRGDDARVAAPVPPSVWNPPPAGPQRSEDQLVVALTARFAHRCAVCAIEVESLHMRTLRCLPRGHGGVLIPGFEVIHSLDAVLRKSEHVRVYVGYCPRHRQLIQPALLTVCFCAAGVSIALLGLAAMAWAARPERALFGCLLASIVLFVLAAIAAIWPGLLSITKIDGYGRAWVKGFGVAYLELVPPLGESPSVAVRE